MNRISQLATLVLAATVVIGGWSTSAVAKDVLKVGDEADAQSLSSTTFIKNLEDSPPDMAGKPMVVEFWATWCPPCKRAIPHLTKLQKKYGSDRLAVIGMTQPDSRQTTSDIKKFVQRQGKRMDYWVGIDDEGDVHKAFMKAAEQKGIPCSFIIGGEGRIQFIGSPFDREFDNILDSVVKGRYDHKAMKKAKSHLQAIERARSLQNWDEYYRLSNKVITINPRVFANLYLERFDVEMMDRNNPDKAYSDLVKMVVSRSDDPELFLWMAEKIALDSAISEEQRRMDVAIKLIESARKKAGLKEAVYIAAEAKIRLANGETDQAVKLQRQAFFHAPKNRKDQYNRTLQDYKVLLSREQG